MKTAKDPVKASLVDMDFVPSPLVVLDGKGSIIYANRLAYELVHCDSQLPECKAWLEQGREGAKRTNARKGLKEIITRGSGKQVITMECNGQDFISEWRYAVVRNEKGKLIRIVGTGEDISEKVLLRKALAGMQQEFKRELLANMVEAVERERKEIAYELHDGVNQVLTVCKLLLEREQESGNGSDLVQKASDHICKVINDIRSLAHELNPSDLGNEGLFYAAKDLIGKVGVAADVKIKFSVKGKKFLSLLPHQHSLSLFRIMQEALNNIVKHSGARHIIIILEGSEKSFDFIIQDNGCGFDVKGTKGFGLRNIYARAEMMGGIARIESKMGEGSILSVCIPIK